MNPTPTGRSVRSRARADLRHQPGRAADRRAADEPEPAGLRDGRGEFRRGRSPPPTGAFNSRVDSISKRSQERRVQSQETHLASRSGRRARPHLASAMKPPTIAP